MSALLLIVRGRRARPVWLVARGGLFLYSGLLVGREGVVRLVLSAIAPGPSRGPPRFHDLGERPADRPVVHAHLARDRGAIDDRVLVVLLSEPDAVHRERMLRRMQVEDG